MPLCMALHMDPGVMNSGLHVCMLLTDQLPNPMVPLFLSVLFHVPSVNGFQVVMCLYQKQE